MNEENKKILRELQTVGIIAVVAIVALKIIFYKETVMVIIRTVLAFFWTFIIPGYAILLFWDSKLEFIERFIAAFPISAALVAIISYYLGIMGIHTRYHTIIIPALTIAIVIAIEKLEKLKKKKAEHGC